MPKEIRLKYRWIKQRRKEVLAFIAETYWTEKDTTSKARIEEDLGIYGDDAVELIQKFEQAFHVDMSELDHSVYFSDEGIDFFPISGLLHLLLLPLAILVLPFSPAYFKEMVLYNPFTDSKPTKKYLTVGDLITSSFTHKFTLQKEVLIKLA